MASLYTDEVRIAHYEACRKHAKRCGIVCGIAFWAAALAALNELLDLLSDGVFGGLMQGAPGIFLAKLCTSAVTVLAVLAVWRRSPRLIAAALLGVGICAVAELFSVLGYFLPPFLLAALIAAVRWQKLSEEEGFPRFEITYAEKRDRQRVEALRLSSRMTAPAHDEIMDELERFEEPRREASAAAPANGEIMDDLI